MATQSSLSVATGASITEAWGDSVAAHLLTTETGTPATTFEGKHWVHTADDECYRDNGTAQERWDGYGAWKSYTPTLANSAGTATSVGNGTIAGAYRYVGGRAIAFWCYLELGSTTTWWSAGNATPALSLPVAMRTTPLRIIGANIGCVLASTSGTIDGRAVYGSSTQLFAYVPQTGGTYPTWTACDQTTPFTWASGFIFGFGGVYESAS